MRLMVIVAKDVPDGEQWARAHRVTGYVVVTPRRLDAARGVLADGVAWTSSAYMTLSDDVSRRLTEAVFPCMLSGAHDRP